MKKWFCCLSFLILGIWGSSPSHAESIDSVSGTLREINEQALRAHIQFLSDDMLEGRGVGSRGEELAIRYVASQFEAIGLLPGGEMGTYFQKVPMLGVTPNPSMVLRFHNGNETFSLQYEKEFIAVTPLQIPEVNLQKLELVFVGYGIQAPEYDWDDYKGADLKGKILLMLNNDPDTGDPNFFGGKARLYYGRWDYKYQMAAKMGAEGAIIIHTTPSAGYPWQVVQSSWSGEQYELPLSESAIKMQAWVTEDKMKELLKSKNIDLQSLYDAAEKREFQPMNLGLNLSIDIHSTIRSLEGTNVLGLLPGNDPQLKNEVVTYSAHHDHLGIGNAVDGDTIYNGALDNASGVAAMLTLAEAYARLPEPPRRSVLFISLTAEESGLLGSAYYAKHPTFPPEKIAANFNMDGINMMGRTRDLVVMGLGKTSMDPLVKDIVEKQGRIVLPDQMPEQGSYYRSDHFSFAKIGVPCIMFDTGLDVIGKPAGWGKQQIDAYIDKHYHQPSDEYDPSWNLEGGVEDTQILYQVGLKVANQDEMPQWAPGDEFEKIRKKS